MSELTQMECPPQQFTSEKSQSKLPEGRKEWSKLKKSRTPRHNVIGVPLNQNQSRFQYISRSIPDSVMGETYLGEQWAWSRAEANALATAVTDTLLSGDTTHRLVTEWNNRDYFGEPGPGSLRHTGSKVGNYDPDNDLWSKELVGDPGQDCRDCEISFELQWPHPDEVITFTVYGSRDPDTGIWSTRLSDQMFNAP